MYADKSIIARCYYLEEVERKLLQHMAEYKGPDAQTDTFNETEYGKLKHRQGNIEHVLIQYNRENSAGTKKTEVLLYMKNPYKAFIEQYCGNRKILNSIKKFGRFFIDNVKFHIDQLDNLGHFIEIEAIDIDGSLDMEVLHKQRAFYEVLLLIPDEDLVHNSYIDL